MPLGISRSEAALWVHSNKPILIWFFIGYIVSIVLVGSVIIVKLMRVAGPMPESEAEREALLEAAGVEEAVLQQKMPLEARVNAIRTRRHRILAAPHDTHRWTPEPPEAPNQRMPCEGPAEASINSEDISEPPRVITEEDRARMELEAAQRQLRLASQRYDHVVSAARSLHTASTEEYIPVSSSRTHRKRDSYGQLSCSTPRAARQRAPYYNQAPYSYQAKVSQIPDKFSQPPESRKFSQTPEGGRVSDAQANGSKSVTPSRQVRRDNGTYKTENGFGHFQTTGYVDLWGNRHDWKGRRTGEVLPPAVNRGYGYASTYISKQSSADSLDSTQPLRYGATSIDKPSPARSLESQEEPEQLQEREEREEREESRRREVLEQREREYMARFDVEDRYQPTVMSKLPKKPAEIVPSGPYTAHNRPPRRFTSTETIKASPVQEQQSAVAGPSERSQAGAEPLRDDSFAHTLPLIPRTPSSRLPVRSQPGKGWKTTASAISTPPSLEHTTPSPVIPRNPPTAQLGSPLKREKPKNRVSQRGKN